MRCLCENLKGQSDILPGHSDILKLGRQDLIHRCAWVQSVSVELDRQQCGPVQSGASGAAVAKEDTIDRRISSEDVWSE
jgi:hypothetical protein